MKVKEAEEKAKRAAEDADVRKQEAAAAVVAAREWARNRAEKRAKKNARKAEKKAAAMEVDAATDWTSGEEAPRRACTCEGSTSRRLI